MRLKGTDLSELVEALSEVINQYIEDNPDCTADEVVAALSFVHGSIFRLASDVPASKLH